MAVISPWTGAGDAVSQQVRQRIVDQLTFAQKQQDMDLANRRQAMLEQEAQQRADEHQATMAERAQQNAETEAAKGVSGLAPNQSIPDPMAKRLSGTMQAANMKMNPPLAQPPNMPDMMQPDIVPGEQPGAVWMGTDQQRTGEENKYLRGRLLGNPNISDRERLAIEMENAGMKVPPGVFEPKPANTTDGNFTLKGKPIVGQKTNGRIMYQGNDVTDQVTPYVTPHDTGVATDNRLDRSYQFHRSALDKLSSPLEQQQQKIGELDELVGQQTPQADALIAPKLLTIMAGGQGSGLKMNEAEISRIVGGRSNWESLKAMAQKWSTDPNAANSITPDQRKQIRALYTAVRQKGQQAVDVVNGAGDALIDAPDVMSHRRVLSETHRKLQSIYGGAAQATAAPAAGGTNDPLGIR